MEFQAYDAGTVLRILVEDGETAALGARSRSSAPTARPPTRPRRPKQRRRRQPQEDASAEPEPEAPAATQRQGVGQGSRPRPATDRAAARRRCKVSPIARRMADQAGIDLAHAGRPRQRPRGPGRQGRRRAADRAARLHPRPAAAVAARSRASRRRRPTGDELRELTPMLKAVAARMAQSKQTVPHFYVESEIDMTRALELRAELNERPRRPRREDQRQRPDRARLRACALIEHPQAHRSYVDGKHVYHAHANVGIAVALDDGLIVPVAREADTQAGARDQPPRPATWPAAPARASSSSARSRAAPSPSPTWACSTSPTSRRSSTRPSRRSSRSARRRAPGRASTARSSCARSCA